MNVFILAKNACEFADVKRKLPKNSRATYVSEAQGLEQVRIGEPVVTGPLWELSEKITEIKKELKKRKIKTRDVKGNVTFDPTRL